MIDDKQFAEWEKATVHYLRRETMMLDFAVMASVAVPLLLAEVRRLQVSEKLFGQIAARIAPQFDKLCEQVIELEAENACLQAIIDADAVSVRAVEGEE